MGIPVDELGVVGIAAGIAAGDYSPTEVVADALDRIELADARVHAWSYLDPDGARREAELLTSEVRRGYSRGPLHGVPIGVKDEFLVRDMPTGMRDKTTLPLETVDATSVSLLRRAGAIILGKTHMPIGDRTPPTRNPWNQEHTAGGTSSGSGAAVGARMVPAAIGEQTAGSNLRPAAYCGVVGMKPTYGRIGRFGCIPYAWSLDHVGIIALSVADVALLLSVMAGPDPRDPTTLSDPPPTSDLRMNERGAPRIGVVRNFFLQRCGEDMRAGIERAVGTLRSAGATVADVHLPDDFQLTWSCWRIITYAEASICDYFPSEESDSSRYRAGSLLPATYYLQARRIRTWLRGMLAEYWVDRDVLLMPTTPGPAPEGMNTGDPSLLIPWSLLGFPSVNVPFGFAENGLPMGLQLVAPPGRDYELLQASAWVESVLGRLPAPSII